MVICWKSEFRRSLKQIRPLAIIWVLFFLGGFFCLLKTGWLPFLLGFILACILAPFVQVLQERGFSRQTAILLNYLFFLGAGLLLVFYLMPLLLDNLRQLLDLIPAQLHFLQQTLAQMQENYRQVDLPLGLKETIAGAFFRVEQMVSGVMQFFVEVIIGLCTHSFSLLLAPLVSYYLLRDFKSWEESLLQIAPWRYRREIKQLAGEIKQVFLDFIKGSFLVALGVGFLTTLGLALIGLDFSVLLGLLVGVTNVIPYFGAIISAIPAVLFAFLKSKWLALYVLGLMILIHQVESNFLAPYILGNSLDLHPLLIVFALWIGGQLWGFVGLLVAVPLTAILKIVLRHLYGRLV